METKDMQREVSEWFKNIGAEYYSPMGIIVKMMEEVGELAREINNKYGDRHKKVGEEEDKVEKEVGDILFAIICLCNKLNIDMGNSFKEIMHKNKSRDKERFRDKKA